ncbi:hypothetical protein [Brevibacillus fulvus]|uniref:Uncharacterized protein n=1 Tax=Brevibacillus fulvus TaxID=1125967 RepID=A0A938Y030_9BACL|nr:hypothetical protein [Brevibacillus fulvus]MBM7588670.1 hypothetical protein [Brevibacillus fulvus]
MKRLQKSEFILTYMIIISFACFIGGFFLGAGYMKAKADAQTAAQQAQAKALAEREKLLKEQKLYKDQDFTRFYYGIYAPAAELKQRHFETLDKLDGKPRNEQEKLLAELSELAEDNLKDLQKEVILNSSPLLVQAKADYTQSLSTYLDGIEHVLSAQTNTAYTAEQISSQLQPFQQNWLNADAELYQAVATWDSAYASKRPLPNVNPLQATLTQWKSAPFHFKVFVVAENMAAHKKLYSFTPLDLTARLDAIMQSEQNPVLALKNVSSAVELLTATNAVRAGDYQKLRAKLYQSLQTPEMPLYTE